MDNPPETRRESPLAKLRNRLLGSLRASPSSRIMRRRAMTSKIWRNLPYLKFALLTIGYLWMLIIPWPELGRGSYIDENALQPGQVTTSWTWTDVHNADRYLRDLEALVASNATSSRRAEYFSDQFTKLGFISSTQSYTFTTSSGENSGVNAYAVMKAPRASGNEAMLISASWLSRTGEVDGTLNLRGASTVLALAAFLKKYSLWAKDFVFVISDEYLDGMHAFISSYHSHSQSNMRAEHLTHTSGVIWTALNVDYPGHSFSHLGIFHEGINGRLPNQDLINSFQRISRYTGGVPVTVYDHLDAREFSNRRDELELTPTWLPSIIRDNPNVRAYAYHAKNVMRHFSYQSTCKASGVHGLLHKYRIDAITLFAIPAAGPHGFHAVGRTIESTLRTMNNLLERLHASFFFYILTGPDRFMKIGNYLPSAVIVSIGMMFTGLGRWVDAGWILEKSEKGTEKWRTKDRPVIPVLGIMALTHIIGGIVFYLLTSSLFIQNMQILLFATFAVLFSIPLVIIRAPKPITAYQSQVSTILQAMNLCFASTVISITTVLNFSLAALLAILLGIPLASSSILPSFRVLKYALYALLGMGWMILAPKVTIIETIREWEVLGVWFAPLVCGLYTPLVMQAAIVSLLL